MPGISNVRFGSVPVNTVKNALGSDKAFVVYRAGEDQPIPCRVSGPFKKWPYAQDELDDIANRDRPYGVDPKRPFEVYMLGFRYYQDPRYLNPEEATHGQVYVQDGHVTNLDLDAFQPLQSGPANPFAQQAPLSPGDGGYRPD